MMLGILLGIGLFGGMIIGIPIFIVWVATEHSQAKKYRHLVMLASQQKPATATGWTVTYREKGKIKTINADGKDESEMMKSLVKQGIGYDKIISSVRNQDLQSSL